VLARCYSAKVPISYMAHPISSEISCVLTAEGRPGKEQSVSGFLSCMPTDVRNGRIVNIIVKKEHQKQTLTEVIMARTSPRLSGRSATFSNEASCENSSSCDVEDFHVKLFPVSFTAERTNICIGFEQTAAICVTTVCVPILISRRIHGFILHGNASNP